MSTELVSLNREGLSAKSLPISKNEGSGDVEHAEWVTAGGDNLVYDESEVEPELRGRTYFALAAMFILNLVQVLALQAPPAVLTYIGEDLNNPGAETWIPNSMILVQAVLCPIISSASDTFQIRKALIVGLSLVSFIGAAIAPGSGSIYRLIGAQVMIGFGFATVPLAYSIPSEILPRKWRPAAQALINIAAAIGASIGPLVIGALTSGDARTGWRTFYWVEMALWGGSAIGLIIGYRPPKRHARFDHLSPWQKIGRLDLRGCGLLLCGLTLFLVGLNLGGSLYKWVSAPVLSTLMIGVAFMVAFGVYEWKFTKTGILHHDLFRGGKERGRTFAICVGLIIIEGIMLFAYVLFYPILTVSLFERNPFLETARAQPFWVASALSSVAYGYMSTKMRTIRLPMFVGFFIYAASFAAFASIQPGQNINALIYSGLAGVGFGAPLIIIVAGVQLSTPHSLIATATAATTSARAVSAAVFTAIYSAIVTTRLNRFIPSYITEAALNAGLPLNSVSGLIQALTGNDQSAVQQVNGVTPAVISAGTAALRQAYADAVRPVFIIASAFGVLACTACFFLGDMKSTMNYKVDAPVEELHAKQVNMSGL